MSQAKFAEVDVASIQEVAAALRMSHDTVLRAINSGRLPATRSDLGYDIEPAAVLAYLNDHLGPDQERIPMPTNRSTVKVSDLPLLMYLDEVAEQTRLSKWWLTDRCRRREIPHVRTGRRFQMTAAHVEKALLVAELEAQGLPADDLAIEQAARTKRGRRRKTAATSAVAA